jgi:Glycosyltransferase sugar-binding region containing DXD motif
MNSRRGKYRGGGQHAAAYQPHQTTGSNTEKAALPPLMKQGRLLVIGGSLSLAFFVVGLRYIVQNFRSSSPFVPSTLIDGRHIFGPATSLTQDGGNTHVLSFTLSEQRSFLNQYGWACQKSFAAKDRSTETKNVLVERFDALPEAYGIELWKYCRLYLAPGVYWDTSMAQPFLLPNDSLSDSTANRAIAIDFGEHSDTADFVLHQPPLHHSFLQIREMHSKVALGMIRYLLEAESLSPTSLHETLTMFVANDINKKRSAWKFMRATCQDVIHRRKSVLKDTSVRPPVVLHVQSKADRRSTKSIRFASGETCSAPHDEPCCQVWSTGDAVAMSFPVMSLLHLNLISSPDEAMRASSIRNPLPFSFMNIDDIAKITDNDLGMPASHLPFIATVREFKTNAPPATLFETPNYFDILLRNNCLPPDKECYKCLKLGYKEGDEGGDCSVCEDKCPCYCKALCQIRPPPKRLAAVWEVTLPRYRKDPNRLIPRVIHQTWFESVSKKAYPNMSRLIESFRQSGWEYEFYDDARAAQFISAHFPPQVREAYDAIIPGAFKADLFRYCVLLIRGGVYADMDIMLESNLDQAVDGSIGFMTAQDSPGETIGHRSCLWNGLMASAPGHVFLAQTIQTVMNNVRNRFTSVDYDDMLCPNPVLSVSHTVDTLFTCGPCILGASLNDVLKRHRQTGFEFGEIDLYETEKKKHFAKGGSSTKRVPVSVDPDDPRLLIPGRSLLLRQDKTDMGAHRFTNAAANLIVASTDMPEYDDRPKSIEHYSKSHVKFGVYGLTKLYKDTRRANEEINIVVKSPIPATTS